MGQTAFLVLAFATLLCAEEGDGTPLGSSTFLPSPERPVGWRGDGTAQFPGAHPVVSWDEKTGSNVLWKLDLPFGYGSPIAVGDRVFTQADRDVLYAVDAATGRILWQSSTNVFTREEEAVHRYGGWLDWHGLSFPTPVSDGRVVFSKFAETLECHDLGGRQVWKTNIGESHQKQDRRPILTQSPLLAGGRIVFLTLASRDTLVGYDPQTGREAWRTPVGRDHGNETCGAAVPGLTRVKGVDLIVTRSGDVVRASDGKLMATNLTARAGYSFLEYGLVSAVVSPDNEFLVCFRRPETRKTLGGILYAMALRLQLGEDSDSVTATTVWGPKPVEPVDGGGSNYATQVNHTLFLDGHWYLQGWPDLITLDAKDGRTVAWKKAPAEMAGHTVWHEYPTPHRAGRYIFTGDRNGVVAVYGADPQWNRVALNRVDGTWHGNPFFHGDRIYIRTRYALYCIGPGMSARKVEEADSRSTVVPQETRP